MENIQQMREQRTAAAAKLKALVENNTKKWTPENQTEYDGIVANIDGIDASIGRAEKVLAFEVENNTKIENKAIIANISVDEAEHILNKENTVFDTLLRNGFSALNTEQVAIYNAMSKGTNTEGGYLTPNDFSANLLQSLKDFGGMRSVAQIIRTSTGNTMDYPTTDATSEKGEILGENATAADEDAAFGTKSLAVQKFSSKAIAVPFELLRDSSIDLAAHINERLTQRLGRITNSMFTVGNGTNQPMGLMAAAGAGKIASTGGASSVAFDDLVDLIHSVDPAYRSAGQCGFMFHDTTLRELKKLKDGQGRPLWLAGLSAKEPDTINNYQYTINQDVAQMAANSKSIAFGDFSRYTIRDVSDIMLYRMEDSYYTRKGQVGFLAFMRSGGNLMDVGGAVKYYQNSAT